MSRKQRLGVLLVVIVPLLGCERAMHDMYQQPKDKPQQPSSLFADGNSARPPVPGSVAMAGGATADASGGRRGHVQAVPEPGPALPLDDQGRDLAQGAAGARNEASPLPMTLALLERGRERFDIYCAPCHGRSGDGKGMVVQRGFPSPPSFHSDKLRLAPDSHMYQVISDGYGVMYPYADRIDPDDRWAIVAYVRALQLSRHVTRDRLDVDDIRALDAMQAHREGAR
jgi:mono/diheme cytochrome c family protein